MPRAGRIISYQDNPNRLVRSYASNVCIQLYIFGLFATYRTSARPHLRNDVCIVQDNDPSRVSSRFRFLLVSHCEILTIVSATSIVLMLPFGRSECRVFSKIYVLS